MYWLVVLVDWLLYRSIGFLRSNWLQHIDQSPLSISLVLPVVTRVSQTVSLHSYNNRTIVAGWLAAGDRGMDGRTAGRSVGRSAPAPLPPGPSHSASGETIAAIYDAVDCSDGF